MQDMQETKTGPVEVDNGSGCLEQSEASGVASPLLSSGRPEPVKLDSPRADAQEPTPLRGALRMAAYGLPVIPLNHPIKTTAGIEHARCSCGKYPCGDGNKNVGKHPLFEGWKEQATTDEATIRRWAKEYPGCNFGYVLGDDFIGIDGDGRNGLDEGEVELARAGHRFSDTLTVQSGDGWHRLYGLDGFRPAKLKLATGIDGRTGSMILVAPDSLHWSGARYILTADVPIAPLDEWARERLGKSHGQEDTEKPLPDLGTLPSAQNLLAGPEVSERIRELFRNEPNGEWSGPLWELEHRLREAGFHPEEALVICWASACNKYQRDRRPIEALWQEVLKNYATAEARTLAEFFGTLNEYLALDDTGHVYFALGVAISANLDGDPLWGMLVGAPSGGKTEAIRGLDYLAIHVDELTAPSLLSWISKGAGKNRKQEPTGILTRTGDRGFVTVGDFSTVLAMSDRGSRDQLFANLRRVYDGGLTRELGNAPGPLEWSGRCTFLAGCTPAIDNYTAHADQLGPRWLYYRLRPRLTADKREASRKKRIHEAEVESYRSKVREMAASVVRSAGVKARSVQLPEPIAEALDDVAIVVCYGRGAVPRNGYGQREIIGDAVVEEPPRLTGQLVLLARSLLALGLDEDATLALCRRAALDSMPEIRRRVLEALVNDHGIPVAEVARRTACDRKVARMALEDLAAIGLTDSAVLGADELDPQRYQPHPWFLVGSDADLVRRVFKAERWGA